MFSRRMVVIARDHRLPAMLTYTNRMGVPVLSILMQSCIVFFIALITIVAIPDFFTRLVSQVNLVIEGYNILQAVASMTWIVYSIVLLLLPLMAIWRKKTTQSANTSYLLLWIMTLVGCLAALIGLWDTLFISWVPSLIPNSPWSILIAGITLLSLAAGW